VDGLRLIRKSAAQRTFEPSFLAHVGTAQLELGNLEAGRAAAQDARQGQQSVTQA